MTLKLAISLPQIMHSKLPKSNAFGLLCSLRYWKKLYASICLGFTIIVAFPQQSTNELKQLLLTKSWEAIMKKGPSTVDSLIVFLRDKNVTVRENATFVLGEIKDQRSIIPLINCLDDSEWSVQMGAEDALVKIGSLAVDPLIKSMQNFGSLDAGRKNAISALGLIRDPRSINLLVSLLGDPFVGSDSANSLSNIGRPSIEPLLNILNDQDDTVRGNSARALGSIKDIQGVEPLIARLQVEKNQRVVAAIADALEELKDNRAIQPLQGKLPSWYANGSIISALLSLGWIPSSDADNIYRWIGEENKTMLITNWAITEKVLMSDIDQKDNELAEANAINTLIALGVESTIPKLIDTLNSSFDVSVANSFLNSQNAKLIEAAQAWANGHGYTITYGQGSSGNWGSW